MEFLSFFKAFLRDSYPLFKALCKRFLSFFEPCLGISILCLRPFLKGMPLSCLKALFKVSYPFLRPFLRDVYPLLRPYLRGLYPFSSPV